VSGSQLRRDQGQGRGDHELRSPIQHRAVRGGQVAGSALRLHHRRRRRATRKRLSCHTRGAAASWSAALAASLGVMWRQCPPLSTRYWLTSDSPAASPPPLWRVHFAGPKEACSGIAHSSTPQLQRATAQPQGAITRTCWALSRCRHSDHALRGRVERLLETELRTFTLVLTGRVVRLRPGKAPKFAGFPSHRPAARGNILVYRALRAFALAAPTCHERHPSKLT
jgi:hypothetical protein